jgi:hypothetical protein
MLPCGCWAFLDRAYFQASPYFGPWVHGLVVFAAMLIMLKLFDENCNYAGVHFIQDSKNRTRMAQIQRFFRDETRNYLRRSISSAQIHVPFSRVNGKETGFYKRS